MLSILYLIFLHSGIPLRRVQQIAAGKEEINVEISEIAYNNLNDWGNYPEPERHNPDRCIEPEREAPTHSRMEHER